MSQEYHTDGGGAIALELADLTPTLGGTLIPSQSFTLSAGNGRDWILTFTPIKADSSGIHSEAELTAVKGGGELGASDSLGYYLLRIDGGRRQDTLHALIERRTNAEIDSAQILTAMQMAHAGITRTNEYADTLGEPAFGGFDPFADAPATPPEPVAIAGGLAYHGMISVVSAKGGTGKSWLAVKVAVDWIADGGAVVWLDTERQKDELHSRAWDYARANGADFARLRGWFRYFAAARLAHQRERIATAINGYADAKRRIMLIVDSSTRAVDSVNSQNEVDGLFNMLSAALDYAKGRGGALSVLLLHHESKADSADKTRTPTPTGNSAWRDRPRNASAARTVILYTGETDKDGKPERREYIEIARTKFNAGKLPLESENADAGGLVAYNPKLTGALVHTVKLGADDYARSVALYDAQAWHGIRERHAAAAAAVKAKSESEKEAAEAEKADAKAKTLAAAKALALAFADSAQDPFTLSAIRKAAAADGAAARTAKDAVGELSDAGELIEIGKKWGRKGREYRTELDDARDAAARLLGARLDGGLTAGALDKALADELGIGERTANKRRRELESAGDIERGADGAYRLASGADGAQGQAKADDCESEAGG